MDELNQNTQNSSDFQKEKMQKKNNEDNNATICDMQTDSESANNDISIKNEIIGTNNRIDFYIKDDVFINLNALTNGLIISCDKR